MPADQSYCPTCRTWRSWPCGEVLPFCLCCLEPQQVWRDVPTPQELLAHMQAWRERTPQAVQDSIAQALRWAEQGFGEEEE